MDVFLSCDWGTSSFRLRLVQTHDLRVLAEEVNNDGIALLHSRWMAENAPESERVHFYQAYLHGQLKKIEAQVGYALRHLPLLVSGMASSGIGMLELPYKKLPLRMNAMELTTHVIKPSAQFSNEMLLISGVQTSDDVMRGEETLLAGCDDLEGIYIFPGTHAKHVGVESGLIKDFKTYITGELFQLLATKSILANSLEAGGEADAAALNTHFENGIRQGASSNLLNAVFQVRTAALFKTRTPKDNYQYLSGLLIGAELKELAGRPPQAVFLVCGNQLMAKYEQGLKLLGLGGNLQLIAAGTALMQGQLRIYKSQKPV